MVDDENVDVLQNVSNADAAFGAPRLDPPMRLLRPSQRPGGTVGVLFPMMDPRGKHSLPVPDPAASFDLGTLVINLLADYLGSGGTRVSLEACMVANTCPWLTK